MPFDHWLAFAAASFVLVAIPGPTVTLVVSYALAHGRRSAAATVAGVALGDFTAMTASMAGLGVLLAASVDRPEIKVLADFFHMSLQSEPLAHLEAARGWLGHTHTSGPDRYFPLPGQPWDQRSFLESLAASGYDGRVSVESWTVRPGSSFAQDAAESAAYLRRLLSDIDRSV